MERDIAVQVEHVTKVINGQTLLDQIDFTVYQGEILSITGKNASGKSLLFKLICGLIKPTQGQVRVFGEPVGTGGRFAPDTGGLIEYPGLLPHLSAYRNLEQLAAIRNIAGDREIRDALARVGLSPDDKRAVKKYSLGMRQKLGIAQAMLENPKLLVLDEPTNNLDDDSVTGIQNLLLKQNQIHRTTIILASHQKGDVERLSQRILTLEKGRITSEIQVGSV